MPRHEKGLYGRRSRVRAASEVARHQLGFYVRNCALSPAAGTL